MRFLDLLMEPTKAMRRYSPLQEDLTEGQENELLFMYNRVREGEHRMRVRDERTYASADPVVREVYSEDSVPLPGSVDRLVKRTPGAVVMPRKQGELLELLEFAKNNAVPLVPRGGGTSLHGGAVPVEGGVVADLRGMDRVLEIDEDEATVRVEGGITWLDLEETANEHGLSVPVMPETAPMSTLAGALAMDKSSLGTFGHGSLRDVVDEVTLLTPDLEERTLAGDDLDLVLGCQGRSGFILDAKIRLVDQKNLEVVGATFDMMKDVEHFVGSLPQDGVDTVTILGPQHVGLLLEAKGEPRALPKKKRLVVVAIEADQAERLVPDLQARAETLDGDWMKDEQAQWAWKHRFQHRCYQRFGPSLLVAEAECAISDLADAWWAADDAIEAPEYTLRAISTGHGTVKIVASILCDERLPTFPLAWGNRLAFMDAVKDAGGRATAPGLLTPGEAKPVLGKDRVKRLSTFCKERDPHNIMNPGKILPARVKGVPILPTRAAVVPGVAMMKAARDQFSHRRESTTEPSNRALKTVMGRTLSRHLAEVSDDLYACSRLGLTNRVGNLHRGLTFEKERPRAIVRAHRFETQLPRGVVSAGKAILEGAEPGEHTARHALSLPAVPTYQNASQNDTPVLAAIEGVREAVQRATRYQPGVQSILDHLAETGNVLGEDPDTRGDWMPAGAPSGVDTTTLLVTSDVASYERSDDAGAIFNVLQNAGFGFTTLGPRETHFGTVPHRLGAVDEAQQALVDYLDKAVDRMESLPSTLVTASSEDADLARRRISGLLARTEHEGFAPRVLTATEALASLVSSGRLAFQGDTEDADAEGEEATDEEEAAPEGEAATDEEQASSEQEPEQAPQEDTEEAGEEDEQEGDEGFEPLKATLVHSPFATEQEQQALGTVAEAVPGLTFEEADPADVLVPDVSYALLNPDQTDALGMELKKELAGSTVVVGCVDLAHVLDDAGLDVRSIHSLVAERMEVRAGGVQVDVGAGEEEEEGFQEFEIPEEAHRVELVKEEAAIPVFPDESILDAAENHGFDLPFDCRAGSCVTCCARWEGAAPDQSQAQAISEEEQETHVLTCVSKPTGDVKIWTDEKP